MATNSRMRDWIPMDPKTILLTLLTCTIAAIKIRHDPAEALTDLAIVVGQLLPDRRR